MNISGPKPGAAGIGIGPPMPRRGQEHRAEPERKLIELQAAVPVRVQASNQRAARALNPRGNGAALVGVRFLRNAGPRNCPGPKPGPNPGPTPRPGSPKGPSPVPAEADGGLRSSPIAVLASGNRQWPRRSCRPPRQSNGPRPARRKQVDQHEQENPTVAITGRRGPLTGGLERLAGMLDFTGFR